jgi:hypothetical protein
LKPTKFKEANKDLLKPQGMTDEQCGSLPVFTDGNQCISHWQLTWKERFQVLFFGKIWLGVISGQTQPPVWVDSNKNVFGKGKAALKIRLHNAIYVRYLVDRKYLNWWWMKIVWGDSFLPFYMDIPFSKYTLAAWNCGSGWKDFRVTIRQQGTGEWMFTIKRGDHEDEKRCSIWFTPLKINLARIFNK